MLDDLVKRVIQIRTDADLSQSKFAEKLNLSRSTVSLIEKGERKLTPRTLSSIVERFGVNYDWLTTGNGDPYIKPEHTIYDMLAEEYGLDELDVEIIKQYMALEPLERDVFKKFIKRIRGID